MAAVTLAVTNRKGDDRMEFVDYQPHARAFLARARAHLGRFDDSNEGSGIVYAALDLRFGIEARLYDYLQPTLKRLGRSGPDSYKAKKLLAKLRDLAPESEDPARLRIINEQTGGASPDLVYTPVTSTLASDHGKLGGVLHYRFFHRHKKSWMIPMRSEKGRRTLHDWRHYLAEVADRLETACSGTLLTHPTFTTLVSEVLD